jgi:peptide/nickel transport system substrate-binding protein
MKLHLPVRSLTILSSAFVLVGLTSLAFPAGRGQEPGGSNAPFVTTELLRAAPFDRITLTDNTVVLVEPVSPRPLPPIEAARGKKGQRVRVKGSKAEIPLEGNVGLPGEATRFKPIGKEKGEGKADDEDGEGKVKIHLLEESDVRDFEVKRSSIRKIEYFEDILLEEGKRLVLARGYAAAFECYLRVQVRNPGWPGLDERINELLYAEGSSALIGGDNERGLRLLRELLARKRDFPGLLDQISTAYAGWITRALELGQFVKGRRFLHDLEEMAPEHPVVRKLRERFIELAQRKAREGEPGDEIRRLDALVDALRIWPTLEGAAELYAPAFAAVPTLEVAVNDVPSPLGPWLRTPADERVSRLLYRPVLGSDSDEARQGKEPGQLAAAVETSDLGRRLIIRLQPGIPWSDGSRQVTAVDVARTLIDRSDPNSPKYQARWADLLDRVESPDDTRIDVRLNRPLIRLGPWFDRPVGPAHAGIDGRVATADQQRVLVSDGPFCCRVSSEQAIDLGPVESRSGTPAAGPSRVRRVREIRHARPGSAVEALLRGDVSLAAHIPAGQLSALASSPDIKVGRYRQPAIHLLALDGRNRVLKNRSFRRGLSYAIDRRTFLDETVLGRPGEPADAVADGPMPRGSYADAPGVKPLGYNPAQATMLIAAAHKELGGTPIELKLEYPAVAEAQAVVPRLLEAIRAVGLPVGLKIEGVEVPESQLESELRAGRKFDMAYRVLRCDEPVLEAGPLLCPGYDSPPETDALASAASTRILQLLLQLERAADVPTARGLALQIDRESRDELPVIPLWQVVDHYAWRTRLSGPAEVADHLYQGIESWEIRPWIAMDPWTVK